jgi:hypothetical protein
MPAVKVTWCDGGLRPERPEKLEAGRAVADATYVGDKGIIMHASHGAQPQRYQMILLSRDQTPGLKGQAISLRTGSQQLRQGGNQAMISHMLPNLLKYASYQYRSAFTES